MTILSSVARQYPNPVDTVSIFQETGLSVSYTEQILAPLRAAKLVVGVRGPGGGYTLTRDPANISLADILRSVDPTEPDPRFLAFESEQKEILNRFTLDRLT